MTRYRRRKGERGQSLVETLIALTFLFFLVQALIQLVLLASTRHLVNYAAFAGARASLYGDGTAARQGREAVRQIGRLLDWGPDAQVVSSSRTRYRVRYPTPLAMPIFTQRRQVPVLGEAPAVRQNVPERGDNAGP